MFLVTTSYVAWWYQLSQMTSPFCQSMSLPLWTRPVQFLVVLWVPIPFKCQTQFSSQLILHNFYFMSRLLTEAWAKAHSTSSGGSVAFEPPPLPLPLAHTTKPRLSNNPQNHISLNSLRPLVPATQCFTKWIMPYGIACLDQLSHQVPIDIMIHHHLCLANCILPSTLSNFVASLLQFTKFCDDYSIPESECMPTLESFLSHFIATWGVVSVGRSAMKLWLEGLQLWHQINEAPWHGSHMLKRVVSWSSKLTPAESTQPKREPITIEHLKFLHCNLDLSNTFDIAIFTVACIAFWCCCR